MPRGKFLTFEGGEGAGKSTQIDLLAELLRRKGMTVHATREPGGCPAAEDVRRLLVNGDTDRWDPMSEALLHYAARCEHLRHVIRPRLQEGTWVLSDRFADSTMAYQGYAHGLGRAPIETLHALVVGGFVPDLTLILDLPVSTGLARAAARHLGEDRYERLGSDFHNRLREAFRDIARREPGRCAVIDAEGPIEKVHAAIAKTVSLRLGVDLS